MSLTSLRGAPAVSAAPSVLVMQHGNIVTSKVALTFDDAPDLKCVPPLLALLREEKVKATFFLIGAHLKLHPEQGRLIMAEGHEIGNHSMSHRDALRSSAAEIETEVAGMQQMIQTVLGITPTIYRPPYGNVGARLLQTCERERLSIIKWDVDPFDWQTKTTRESIVRTVLKNANRGSIILLHATRMKTVEAVSEIIPALRQRGFQFVTVSELIGEHNARAAEIKANPRLAAGAGGPLPGDEVLVEPVTLKIPTLPSF